MSPEVEGLAPLRVASQMRARFPELDGIRGVAIAAVIVFHYVGDPKYGNRIGAYAGWLGVDLFFVLSGFLITRILVTSRDASDYYARFYRRRAQRILPPFFLVLATLFGAACAYNPHQPFAWWLLHAGFLTSYAQQDPFGGSRAVPVGIAIAVSVFWSVSVEEQFYLFWAPIVKRVSLRVLGTVLLGILVVEPLLRAELARPRLEYNLFPTRLDDLATGALIALLVTHPEAVPALVRRVAEWGMRHGAILGSVPLILVLVTGDYATDSYAFSCYGYTLIALGFGCFVGYTITRTGGSHWLLCGLRRPVLRRLGTISYTLYLSHLAVRMAVDAAFSTTIGLTSASHRILDRVISLGAALLLASASWVLVERPILNRRQTCSAVPKSAS